MRERRSGEGWLLIGDNLDIGSNKHRFIDLKDCEIRFQHQTFVEWVTNLSHESRGLRVETTLIYISDNVSVKNRQHLSIRRLLTSTFRSV